MSEVTIEVNKAELDNLVAAIDSRIEIFNMAIEIVNRDIKTYEDIATHEANDQYKAYLVSSIASKNKEINLYKRKQLEYTRIKTKVNTKPKFILFKKEQMLLKDIKTTIATSRKDMDEFLKNLPNLYKSVKMNGRGFIEKLNTLIAEDTNVYIIRVN